ncbi:hypothetical protein PHET_07345 [Paragonimus heterotremus]|uniref:Uncharacterized protein n=1 Tax=Paragonimus heterotremus TaxID=100268 RepID=A0A8J4T5Q2_9TREM|nr:hypothetical protein PHET_07345 [Paragonimus heterotremus]
MFPWLNESCCSQPLATSTQTTGNTANQIGNNLVETSVDENQDEQVQLYKTQEWQLRCYSRLRATDSQHTDGGKPMDTSEHDQPATVNADEREVVTDDEWETWESENDSRLVVRLAGFGHLCILSRSDVIESYFLILAKRWMKAVLLDDEVMIMAKRLSKISRLRLSFFSTTDATEFYTSLGRFASLKIENTQRAIASQETSDPLGDRLLGVLRECCTKPVLTSDPCWATEWPTDSLDGLVRLCLQDPNFPGFVRRVDAAMKRLITLPNSSLKQL